MRKSYIKLKLSLCVCYLQLIILTIKTEMIFYVYFSHYSTPPACGRSTWPTADQNPPTLQHIKHPCTPPVCSTDVSEVTHPVVTPFFCLLLLSTVSLKWQKDQMRWFCWLSSAKPEDVHQLSFIPWAACAGTSSFSTLRGWCLPLVLGITAALMWWSLDSF